MVPMILVAMLSGRGVTTKAMTHEAELEVALVPRTVGADMNPEDANMNMTMTEVAMRLRRPPAARESDVGPMLSPVLGGWLLLELCLGRAGLASVLIMMTKANLTKTLVQVKATAMRYVAIWDAKR